MSQQVLNQSSFQTEIPHDARGLFAEALAELRPCLWNYVPKLVSLFDALSNPSKLKTQKFNIELATDDDIRNATPDSELLINAFECSNPIMTDDPVKLRNEFSTPDSQEKMNEAFRLDLIDDVLTHFYVKKVNARLIVNDVTNVRLAWFLG